MPDSQEEEQRILTAYCTITLFYYTRDQLSILPILNISQDGLYIHIITFQPTTILPIQQDVHHPDLHDGPQGQG